MWRTIIMIATGHSSAVLKIKKRSRSWPAGSFHPRQGLSLQYVNEIADLWLAYFTLVLLRGKLLLRFIFPHIETLHFINIAQFAMLHHQVDFAIFANGCQHFIDRSDLFQGQLLASPWTLYGNIMPLAKVTCRSGLPRSALMRAAWNSGERRGLAGYKPALQILMQEVYSNEYEELLTNENLQTRLWPAHISQFFAYSPVLLRTV